MTVNMVDPYCFLVSRTQWVLTFIILVCLSNSNLDKKKLLKFAVNLEMLPNQWKLNIKMKFREIKSLSALNLLHWKLQNNSKCFIFIYRIHYRNLIFDHLQFLKTGIQQYLLIQYKFNEVVYNHLKSPYFHWLTFFLLVKGKSTICECPAFYSSHIWKMLIRNWI